MNQLLFTLIAYFECCRQGWGEYQIYEYEYKYEYL